MIRIKGAIESCGQLRCITVPAEVARLLGGGGTRVPVSATVAGRRAQTSLVRRQDGDYRLFLPTELRRAGHVDVGDRVSVQLEPDVRDGEPELPPALLARLAELEGGLKALEAASPADRRQLVRWISAAKSAGARENRIEKAAERIVAASRARSRPR